jgi:hypothetical protein
MAKLPRNLAANHTVIHAPSFGGGRLLLLNRLLRCFALAHVTNANPNAAASSATKTNTAAARGQVRLILDDNLTTARDLRLPVQNVHGDVVHLEVPDHGKLGYGSRAAFGAALLDTLPSTAQVEQAVELLLPEAQQTPLEAAAALWSQLFPNLFIETIPRGAPSPEMALDNSRQPAGITWICARHRQAMEELGISFEQLLLGETACKESLRPIPAGELGASIKQFLADNEKHMAQLKPLAQEVDSKLIGSWARLRREWRSAMTEFSERADRAGRNRVGIRNTRLHGLAQAVRPHDAPQEQGLSLLSAFASFQLGYRDFSGYITTLDACAGQENVQLHS